MLRMLPDRPSDTLSRASKDRQCSLQLLQLLQLSLHAGLLVDPREQVEGRCIGPHARICHGPLRSR